MGYIEANYITMQCSYSHTIQPYVAIGYNFVLCSYSQSFIIVSSSTERTSL